MRESLEREYREWAQVRRDRLRRTAFLLCGDWHLADDLTQTTLAKMYAAWPRVHAWEGPDGLAHRVLVNAYLDERRRPWRRERQSQDLPHAAGDDQLEAVLDRHVVLAALVRLPPRQRAVVVLRYWEDLSIDQVAAALGCSAGTVKSQTAKAQAHLRHLLGPLSQDLACAPSGSPATTSEEQ